MAIEKRFQSICIKKKHHQEKNISEGLENIQTQFDLLCFLFMRLLQNAGQNPSCVVFHSAFLRQILAIEFYMALHTMQKFLKPWVY